MKNMANSKPLTEAGLSRILDQKLDEILDQKLEKSLQQVVQDISDLQDSKWNEANAKFEKLFESQDRMINILESLQTENTVGTEQIRELRIDVDNHDVRLKSLELAKN